MMIRFNVTLALAATLCLLGCDKNEQNAGAKNDSGTPPGQTNVSPKDQAAVAPKDQTAVALKGQTNEMTTTGSGLKYQVMKRGAGTVSPKAGDTVKVHYHGTLLDGTVFDSSVERGQPISFPLNRVIPGWTEGLQLMKVGDKFKFEIPPNLAYGPNSPSPKIPPNSTLVFEVELLGIE